jgi:hypothetical protein
MMGPLLLLLIGVSQLVQIEENKMAQAAPSARPRPDSATARNFREKGNGPCVPLAADEPTISPRRFAR